MIVWIKEYEGVIDVKSVSMLIRDSIETKMLMNLGDVNDNDIIIMSRMDSEDLLNQFNILIYEDFFEKISVNVVREYKNNYDYYYLKRILEKGKDGNIDTIVSGSSYGCFGIEGSMMSGAVNCALPSQDLYYATKNIYEICENNNQIRNIIVCCSYYYFYSDLSKTQNPIEIKRISNVYYPIFEDLHNCIMLPKRENQLLDSEIFDMEKILELYLMGESDEKYFNDNRKRKDFATKLWSDKSKEWREVKIEEKVWTGKERALRHNKSEERKMTFKENKKIFSELADYCTQKNINLILVVTPATKYYREHLSRTYKDSFYKVLDETKGDVHLLDLFEDENFADDDFNDMDHLGDEGAAKLTYFVVSLLEDINGNRIE